ncbi:MAG: GEVED domain-containing protein, partial [Bacteroidia bacterium]|nr:GEVED domain-containing protein [Bacteroidia bacterium]
MTIIRTLLFALFSLYAFSLINTCSAQTYLSENFDGIWTGTPEAPSGWTQTRTQAILTGAERDWAKNTFTTVWSSVGGTVPTAASPGSGASALWIDDRFFTGTNVPQSERTLLSPTFSLSTSTSPYVRFWYFNSQGPGVSLNVRVVISTDGGVTWVTLSNVVNGFNTTVNTWNRISIPIPASLRSVNNKIGIAIVNSRLSHNPFIDDVTVEEFTPTTITSAVNGDWNAGATWVGGVVPTANNHVVIAHNVVVTNATASTGIIARCQNLTINPGVTLSYGTGSANLLQVFGNVSIDGTLNAFNGTSGRVVYVGGNFTINSGGTATLNTSTITLGTTGNSTTMATGASGLVFTNADIASFTNNGTLTSNRINNIIHLGSGTFTYGSPVGSVPFTFGLYRGLVNPNSNLTLGNAAATTANTTIQRIEGAFTAAPTFSNTNVTSRSNVYNVSNMVGVSQAIVTPGYEIQDILGVRTVTGALVLSTHNNVQLGFPVTVGTSSTGNLILNRGILITSPTNLLTLSTFNTGSVGTDASSTNPRPTNHGSYIVGPLRINFPSSGIGTRFFPLGVGTNFNSLSTPTSNVKKTITLATTAQWDGQTITATLEPAPTGSVTGALTTTIGATSYRLNLNGGPDLPSNATVGIDARNSDFGNSDNIPGNVNNIFVAQSSTGTSGWVARSVSSGVGAPAANTNIFRATSAAAPGAIFPLILNGEYFAFATDTSIMEYSSGEVTRNNEILPIGASTNAVILRIRLTTTGLARPLNISTLNLNTAGTNLSALVNLSNAKVWYTGASTTFAATNQFGSTTLAPNGSFVVTGSQTLLGGDNYFWVTYDVGSGALVGDIFAAECSSAILDSGTQIFASPTAGSRNVTAPMTYISSTGTQPFMSKVVSGSTNNVVLGVQVVSSFTGFPINLTAMNIATTGTTLLSDIANLKIWYTGASNVFDTTTQFGTTVGTPTATQTVTGSVNLTNGINYFWVTFDVRASAITNNALDAQCNSLIVAGSPQTPSVIAPAGNRLIKAYCVPVLSGGPYITNVTMGTMNYNPPVGIGVITINPAIATTSLVRGTTNTISITTDGLSELRAWIDFNDNGVFDSTEIINSTPAAIGAGVATSATFTVPCNAVLGELRMRVVTRIIGFLNTDPCRLSGSGASQDYTITVLDNPLTFNFVTAQQQIGVVAPNTLNRQVLHVPVRVNGCGLARIDEMRFTNTSINVADIVNAKLYRTTGNNFNTNNLRGTVASPVGRFTFALTDTISLNDTMNYWLAYDIAPLATISNVADASFDSLQLNLGLGTLTYHVPTVSNPTGNVLIDAPMTYTSSTVTQANTNVVFRGNNNQEVIGFTVNMSAIGSPVNLTAIDLNLNGLTDTADIQNIRVWYTGASNTFATTTQFGTTRAFAPAVTAPYPFTVTGSQSMLNGVNYFWVTYDVKSSATVFNVVDGAITQVTIAGNNYVPTLTAPAGNMLIRVPYCAAVATNAYLTDIGRIQLFDSANALIFTNGSATPIVNNTLATGTYTNFTGVTPANLTRGLSYVIRMDLITNNSFINSAGLIVYIDYNDDGDFTDAGETAYTSGVNQTSGGVPFLQGTFTIPCSATLGNLRMRVILQEGNSATPSCGTFAFGEVEDYTINVLANPVAFNFSTAQQQTGVITPGAMNRVITRVPVRVSGCGAILNEVRMSTTGTTNNADISNAKLYRTAGSTFNT